MLSKSSASTTTTAASTTDVIDQAAKAILSATHLFFTAGAGMGVDSGLPDFRGKNGFWKAYPPMQKLGLEFHQMSNPQWFEKDPTFAHGFFAHRYNLYTSKKPHQGYYILKEFSEMSHISDYYVFTSNVDGHFAQVFPQEKVAECHGCILYLQCTTSECEDIYTVQKHNDFYLHTHPETCYPLPVDMETFRVPEQSLPKCIHCGALARPNIMMFGDYSFQGERTNEQEERMTNTMNQWRTNIDTSVTNEPPQVRLVTIEIGAGKDVNTIRCESEQVTRRFSSKPQLKSTLIRINPTDHDIHQDSIRNGTAIEIALGGLDALTKIKQRIQELKQ